MTDSKNKSINENVYAFQPFIFFFDNVVIISAKSLDPETIIDFLFYFLSPFVSDSEITISELLR